MENAIDIKHLQGGYGPKLTLHDIPFNVPRGKLTSIIGPNGAGKTTLFRAITGMLPVKEGSILVNGEEIGRAHV